MLLVPHILSSLMSIIEKDILGMIDCHDWYMDSFHFQYDNYFHLLCDDHSTLCREHLGGKLRACYDY
jgi:hypothetical protein